MSERDDYPAGVPCWVTHLAPDVEASSAFYGSLFGWDFAFSGDGLYSVARLDGRDVAGMGLLPPPPGDHPAWITNIRVDDVDDAARRAPEAGGTVLAGPMDFPPAGRLTVVQDPTGAVFGCWEAGDRKGAQRVNEPGAWAMSLLLTPDPEAARAFYSAFLGWQFEPMGGGLELCRLPGYVGGEPGQPVARDVVAAIAPAPGDGAAWAVDFWTDDADAAAARAVSGGGALVGEVADADVFRRATLTDPFGVPLTVSQLVLERLANA